MPVNPDLQGRKFPKTAPYLVGREKVREFARAVLSTSPINFDQDAARAAGYADVVAPPTFAVVIQERTLEQLLAAPDAGIDFSRVVHGEQRFRYSRPIVAGDELTAELSVSSVKSLGGHNMVTAESEIRDAAGDHVVTAISTLVVRGRGVVSEPSVGDLIAEQQFHLTRDTLVRYAGASGDFNPIHYRDDVATGVGLDGVLAHGMLTMGLAVQPIVNWLGDRGFVSDYQVRFTRPVFVDAETGADVTVTAKIGAIDADGIRVDLTATAAGTTVLGKAQVRVALSAA